MVTSAIASKYTIWERNVYILLTRKMNSTIEHFFISLFFIATTEFWAKVKSKSTKRSNVYLKIDMYISVQRKALVKYTVYKNQLYFMLKKLKTLSSQTLSLYRELFPNEGMAFCFWKWICWIYCLIHLQHLSQLQII